jgi:midasin (ATPase involved in ribosome maturation)
MAAKKSNNSGWEDLDLAVKHLRVVYVWGAPGIGKTTQALHLLDGYLQERGKAHKADTACSTTLNEDKVAQELFGHYLPGDGGKFNWHDGPVTMAMRNGALVLNELARASGAVLDAMLEVLDGSRVARIALANGESLTPHEGFKVIATSNSDVKQLDPALRDRFEAILYVERPHPDTIAALNEGVAGLGDVIADSYRDASRALSVRQGFTLAKLIAQGVDRAAAGRLAFAERWGDIDSALKLEG